MTRSHYHEIEYKKYMNTFRHLLRVNFCDAGVVLGQGEAHVPDEDVSERMVARRRPHHAHAGHHLAEGAGHLPSRFVLQADIEKCI